MTTKGIGADGRTIAGQGAQGGEIARVKIEANKSTAAEIDALAARGAKALTEMRPADRDAVMKEVPGYVSDIAATVIGGALDNKLLARNKHQLVALIQEGTSRVATLTSESGDRVAELRIALETEGKANAIREAAPALAAIARAGGATVEQLERLVAQLEVLRELKDGGDIRQLSREVRTKIYAFVGCGLDELAKNVGHQLGRLAYDPVNRAWQTRTP